jgi:hypothetical protein
LRKEADITLEEFLSLLSGLAGETPLGRVVAVRMEKDSKIIRGFGDWEKKIQREWRLFRSNIHKPSVNKSVAAATDKMAQDVFKQLFGKK